MMVQDVTVKSFEEKVLRSEMPVLVDVWAPWCGPCRALSPIVESVAGQFEGRANVYKLNADDAPDLVREYGIMGIPTLLYFYGGKLVDRSMGIQPAAAIARRLETVASLTPEQVAARRAPGALSPWQIAAVAGLLLLTVAAILTRLF
jgi:thioredoxin 1